MKRIAAAWLGCAVMLSQPALAQDQQGPGLLVLPAHGNTPEHSMPMTSFFVMLPPPDAPVGDDGKKLGRELTLTAQMDRPDTVLLDWLTHPGSVPTATIRLGGDPDGKNATVFALGQPTLSGFTLGYSSDNGSATLTINVVHLSINGQDIY